MISFLKNYIISIKLYKYWNDRYNRLGDKAPHDLRLNYDDIENKELKDNERIVSIVSKNIIGSEKYCLDFGCGLGRYTDLLRTTFNWDVLGVDISPVAIQLARNKYKNLNFEVFQNNNVPLKNGNKYDVVFINLVLGGINTKKLNEIVLLLNKNSSKDALFVIVENTSNEKDKCYWKYRNQDFYIRLFNFIQFNEVLIYKEFDIWYLSFNN